jgi:hypothetical protein
MELLHSMQLTKPPPFQDKLACHLRAICLPADAARE